MKHRIIQCLDRIIQGVHRPAISRCSDSLAPARHVRASATDAGIVLLAIHTGQIFTCNHAGKRIWERLAQGHSPASIADDFSRDMEMPEQQARAAVTQFISSLLRLGLVSATSGKGQ